MQCTRCGWWEHSYTFSSDDIDEGLRATSTELTQAILRSYDIASKNVPIEVLNRYIAQNPEKYMELMIKNGGVSCKCI